ncbi:beta-phosphoglucomutase [Geobacillus stearothermophilus 10]|nr:beta-phosphoglucomutase [Geobacillus stearothermophilus 10]
MVKDVIFDLDGVKGVIFDLDGVIVDTAKYHLQAWKRVIEELGVICPKEVLERTKGVDRMSSLNILLNWANLKVDEEAKQVLATRKNKYFLEYINGLEPRHIFPGVIPLIKRLRESGVKIALGSSTRNALFILDRLQLTSYFDAIADPSKVPSKPAPNLFLQVAQLINVAPADCVVVEDSTAGVEAAVRAGMRVLYVGREYQGNVPPTWTIDTLEKLIEVEK